MFCSKCGKKADRGSFCTHCGAKLRTSIPNSENTKPLMRSNIQFNSEAAEKKPAPPRNEEINRDAGGRIPFFETTAEKPYGGNAASDSDNGYLYKERSDDIHSYDINGSLTDDNAVSNTPALDISSIPDIPDIPDMPDIPGFGGSAAQLSETEQSNDNAYTAPEVSIPEDNSAEEEFIEQSFAEESFAEEYAGEPVNESIQKENIFSIGEIHLEESTAKEDEAAHIPESAAAEPKAEISEKKTVRRTPASSAPYSDIDPMFGPPPTMNYTASPPSAKTEKTGFFDKLFGKK